MGSNFRVALHGNGRVLDLLKDLIKSSQYPLEVTDSSNPVVDVWVDCDKESEDTTSALSMLSSGTPVILCSKNLVAKNRDILISTAKEHKNKLYLNSLFSSTETNKYSFMNINEKTIKSLDDNEYLNISSTDESIAKYLYQDLVRAFNRWDPNYEQKRIERLNLKKEAMKENLYTIAKSLDVELESQPCGIDPKLPDNVEVNNVSNGN